MRRTSRGGRAWCWSRRASLWNRRPSPESTAPPVFHGLRVQGASRKPAVQVFVDVLHHLAEEDVRGDAPYLFYLFRRGHAAVRISPISRLQRDKARGRAFTGPLGVWRRHESPLVLGHHPLSQVQPTVFGTGGIDSARRVRFAGGRSAVLPWFVASEGLGGLRKAHGVGIR